MNATDIDSGMMDEDAKISHKKSFVVTLIAKWGKEKIELNNLSPTITIAQVKDMLREKTNVLPKRQKLIGLVTLTKAKITDETELESLKPKSKAMTEIAADGSILSVKHNFILMGTAEKDIFVDPQDHDNLPEVVDDFDLDFNAGSEEWLEHVATGENLKKFTESTAVNIIHAPRKGKPLMVLDLDHTLLDFSRKSIEQASTAATENSTQQTIEKMKRPYMDEFLGKQRSSFRAHVDNIFSDATLLIFFSVFYMSPFLRCESKILPILRPCCMVTDQLAMA